MGGGEIGSGQLSCGYAPGSQPRTHPQPPRHRPLRSLGREVSLGSLWSRAENFPLPGPTVSFVFLGGGGDAGAAVPDPDPARPACWPPRAGALGFLAPYGGGQWAPDKWESQAAARPPLRGRGWPEGAGVGTSRLPSKVLHPSPPAPCLTHPPRWPRHPLPEPRRDGEEDGGCLRLPRFLLTPRTPTPPPSLASGGARRPSSSWGESPEKGLYLQVPALRTGEGEGKGAVGVGRWVGNRCSPAEAYLHRPLPLASASRVRVNTVPWSLGNKLSPPSSVLDSPAPGAQDQLRRAVSEIPEPWHAWLGFSKLHPPLFPFQSQHSL